MRRLLVVLAVCLLPLAGYLGYARDRPALLDPGAPSVGSDSNARPATSDPSARPAASDPGSRPAALEVGTEPGHGQIVGHGGNWATGELGGIGPEILAYLDTAGVEWVRLSFYWEDIEKDHNRDGRSDNDFAWQSMGLDSAVHRLDSAGFKILATVHGTPGWLADPVCKARPFPDRYCDPPESQDEAFYDQVKEFAYHASRHYDKVNNWEFWNEPVKERNHAGGDSEAADSVGAMWRGSMLEFENMVIHFAQGLDSADTNDTLWCCSSSRGWHADPDRDWTVKTLDRIGSYIDGVTYHAYDSATTSTDGQRVVDFMTELLEDLENAGYGSMPVINSEMGIAIPPFVPSDATEDEVQEYMNNVFDSMQAIPQWKATIWFTFNIGDGVQPDDSPRDSVESLRNIVISPSWRSVDSVRPNVYCNLAERAGNYGAGYSCPRVEITSPTDSRVPPGTVCEFSADAEGGEMPYARFRWYPAGVDRGDMGTSLTYRTPSTGSFVMGVEVEDGRGARHVAWETYTVSSTAGC